MISTLHKFIYLHAPKTGGNSIQTILLPYSDDRKVSAEHQDGHDRFEVQGGVTRKKHSTLRDYADVLGSDIGAYKVAISVRHPFDRAVSYYFSPHRWMRKSGDGWVLEQPVWDEAAFMSMLRTVPSMASFLTVGDAFRQPDFVIRYETLEADFRAMCAALEIPSVAPMPHVNKSAGSNLAAEVRANGPLRSFVADFYAQDMKAFGYS